MPAVRQIRAVSETLVRVQFDAPVIGEPSCLDPDSYVFTEGLEALGVVVFRADTVDVMTTPQETDRFYKLDFNPDE